MRIRFYKASSPRTLHQGKTERVRPFLKRFLALFLLTHAAGCAGFRACGPADRWFAEDKAKHVAASAVIAAAATALASGATDRDEAVLIGIGFSFGVGTLKETRDLTVKDTCFSWKDLAWDLVGAAAGATAVAAALDD